jgi:hypothetical protein
MKGTLHKTESGWQVWYYAKDDLYHGSIRVRILPILDHGYVNGPGLSDSNEGLEVDFEIVDEIIDLGRHGSTVVEKAKIVHNWLTMKEGDITVNFKPMPEFDDPKYPEVKIICPRCKALMPCSCNSSWDTIMAESGSWDDSEILAYIIKNYNPPTKKQD